MKRLVTYEIIRREHPAELETAIREEFDNIADKNEILEEEGKSYRLEIEFIGGAFVAFSKYYQAIAVYRVSKADFKESFEGLIEEG